MEPKLLGAAIELIERTPGYRRIGAELRRHAARGRIRVDAASEDRAYARLSGIIMLGPQAVAASPLSLAQTLVHERYHLHQNPFLKTVSFYSGLITRTPKLRRYEQPAYQAAIDFLRALRMAHPHLAAEALAEERAIMQAFTEDYGATLA